METKLVCVFLIFFVCFSCDWILLNVFDPFSYRLPVNMNNYAEKGQTKSLGNGRCTDGRRNQRPDWYLISFFYHRNYQIRCFTKNLDVKKCEWYTTFLPHINARFQAKQTYSSDLQWKGFSLFFSYFKQNIHYESVRFLSSYVFISNYFVFLNFLFESIQMFGPKQHILRPWMLIYSVSFVVGEWVATCIFESQNMALGWDEYFVLMFLVASSHQIFVIN